MEIRMTITPEQRRRIESGQPVRIEDPQTHDAYVVLRADVYERMRAILEDGLDMAQVGTLVERAMAGEDAGDPLLDSYRR
jgi:hypothetical protein